MSKFRMCYFSYPIDQSPAASSQWMYELIERTQQTLLQAELIVIAFDPGDAFTVRQGAPVGGEVEGVNFAAVMACDLLVAFLPGGVATIGAPAEIERALATGKAVLIFTDNAKSWAIAGFAARGAKIVQADEDGMLDGLAWLQEQPTVATPANDEMPDPLPVVLLSPESRLPSRGYHDDAGLDLFVVGNHTIEAGGFLDVPCGVAVELPEWSWGFLTGRSSTLRSKKLHVQTGIIDCGYRGPLFAGVMNLNGKPVEVKDGERLAQLIVLPNLTKDLQPTVVENLSDHARGQAGFGSTGA